MSPSFSLYLPKKNMATTWAATHSHSRRFLRRHIITISKQLETGPFAYTLDRSTEEKRTTYVYRIGGTLGKTLCSLCDKHHGFGYFLFSIEGERLFGTTHCLIGYMIWRRKKIDQCRVALDQFLRENLPSSFALIYSVEYLTAL